MTFNDLKLNKKRVKFATTVDEELLNEIRRISETYDIKLSKIVDASFEGFIKQVKETEKNKDTKKNSNNNTASK